MSRFTEEQLKNFKLFFQAADKDNNGSLSRDELTKVLRKAGFKGSDNEIQQMFDSVDLDGSGEISYEEFMRALTPPKEVTREQLRKAFDSIDKNKDGFIDAEELTQIMAEYQKQMTKEEIAAMIKAADHNNDGKVSFEEILTLWECKSH